MTFTKGDVLKIATLARLKLSETEITTMASELGAILGYVEQLNTVNTEGVQPMAHPLEIQNVFREDQLAPSLSQDDALANAPKRAGNFYSVPAILD